jgi:hypothetical protein
MLILKSGQALLFTALLYATAELSFVQAQPARAPILSSDTPEKNQIEQDFWKSTERVDTPEAYSAYLETYPNGHFSALARAILNKSKSQSRISETRPGMQSTLSAYSDETNTGAVDLRVGDKLSGPVTLLVGRLGAKKQILIPKGEWVVLAATDYKSTLARINLTAVALAQFDGVRAVSFLRFAFNRSPGPNTFWTDAAKCETDGLTAIHGFKDGEFTLRRCMLVRAAPDTRLRQLGVAALWADIDKSMKSLGGVFGQFNIESTMFIVNQQRVDYLQITRLDCTLRNSDGLGCQPLPDGSRRAALEAPNVDVRIAWAKAYLPFAVTGFKRDLDEEDSLKTPQAMTLLPD